MAPGVGAASRELPHDRKCEECDLAGAARAAEACRECGAGYCGRHAEAHRRKFPSHHLARCGPGAQAPTSLAGREAPQKEEEVGASVEPQGEAESETEDSESEEESETEEESEDQSNEESEEDSEEEQESEAEEDDQGESVAEGETKAEGESDREAEMKAERESERKKCPDHGLDTRCQKDGTLICVLGAHQDYQLYTPDEALEELVSRDSSRTKEAIVELVENLKVRSSDPKVTRDQMKAFLQEEFKKVQKVIADEEQKTVHLVDILNVMDTAQLPEILADIQSRLDRQRTQTAQAKELDTVNESAEPKAKSALEGPSGACEENT